MKVSEWTDQKSGLKSEMLWHHLNPVFTKDLLTRRFYKHFVIYPNSITICARDKIQMVSEKRDNKVYGNVWYHESKGFLEDQNYFVILQQKITKQVQVACMKSKGWMENIFIKDS